MPLSDIHFQHSLGKVGDVIIGLLAGNWEGRFLGQAVLLTNLFLVWNSFGCNISAATLRRMISCTMVHHDALCHGAFCRDSFIAECGAFYLGASGAFDARLSTAMFLLLSIAMRSER